MAYTKKSLENSLKVFFAGNPHCKIEIQPKPKSFRIIRPWDDRTLAIWLPRDQKKRAKLIRSLNKLTMPPAFSAYYHKKTKTLEVIWTAYKLSTALKPISNRSFQFSLDGVTHQCSFGDASKDVLNVAEYTMPFTSPSETGHRNIQSFFLYLNQQSGSGPSSSRLDKPRTFRITNVEDDEASMIKVARHLNFFMTYYDNKSPQVLVHTTDLLEDKAARDRYLHGKFPTYIRGRELDTRMLSFWSPQQASTSLMRFLFYYRILEFAASQYVEAKIRSKLKRLVNSPSVVGDDRELLEKIIEAVDAKKQDDIPRLKSLVKETVDTSLLWGVIDQHRDAFCKKTTFEGGYVSDPFLTENCSKEALETGIDKMTDTIRKMRNALSHGKDFESGGVVVPSRKNERLLEPWVLLLEIIAGQVMLNKDII